MLSWVLLVLVASAYLPSRMLILYDGPEAASKDLQGVLTGSRVSPRSMRMDDPKFKMPQLVLDGTPQYSHIVIIGRGNSLTAENYDDLFKYVEGTLDPHSSRLTEDEKMLLPTSESISWNIRMARPTEYVYKHVFEPLPGASIAIFTDSQASHRLLNLLKLLGMKSSKISGSEVGILQLNTTLKENLAANTLSGCDIIGDVKYKPIKQPLSDVLSFSSNFRSDAQNIQELFVFESPSREFTAGMAWQGLENNVRVVAIGFLGALVDLKMMMSGAKSSETYFQELNTRDGTNISAYEYTTLPENSIQAIYQLSRWFGFAKCMLRLSLLKARPVRNTTGCDNTVPAQPSKNFGNTDVVEGNLVHYIVRIEELSNNSQWRPYKPNKALVRLEDLIANNAYKDPSNPGLFPSESRQIKKQLSALSNGLYSRCLQAARTDFALEEKNIAVSDVRSPIYTDIQLHESILGTLFAMNLAVLDEKKGLFDLVMVPDLVRSYHPRLDYSVPGYNRLKFMHHLHVNMDRNDIHEKAYADWPVLAGLAATLILALFATIHIILREEKHTEKEE